MRIPIVKCHSTRSSSLFSLLLLLLLVLLLLLFLPTACSRGKELEKYFPRSISFFPRLFAREGKRSELDYM